MSLAVQFEPGRHSREGNLGKASLTSLQQTCSPCPCRPSERNGGRFSPAPPTTKRESAQAPDKADKSPHGGEHTSNNTMTIYMPRLLNLIILATWVMLPPQEQPHESQPDHCSNAKTAPKAHKCDCKKAEDDCDREDKACKVYCRKHKCYCFHPGCDS